MQTTATRPTTSTATSPAKTADASIQLQREILDIVREETGMHEPLAIVLAASIERGLRKRFGGQTMGTRGDIYIPAPDRAERNAAVLADFNGTNHAQVCAKHSISPATFYRIIGQGKA